MSGVLDRGLERLGRDVSSARFKVLGATDLERDLSLGMEGFGLQAPKVAEAVTAPIGHVEPVAHRPSVARQPQPGHGAPTAVV
jgi:hypothetical protein